MKLKGMLSLLLTLGLSGIVFAQQHEGHGSRNQTGAGNRQTSQTPARKLSDLIKDGERGQDAIKQSVRSNDAERVDSAVSSYLSVLGDLRDAMRLADPDNRDFDRELARVERMSRTNLESLADLRRGAPASLLGSLEDAATATRETYVAATDLRDEIANPAGNHHGNRTGRGSCGYRSGCGTRSGWGWFSRWRGC